MKNDLNIKRLYSLLGTKEIIELPDLLIDNSINVNNRDEFDCIYFNVETYKKYKNDVFVVVNNDKILFQLAYPKSFYGIECGKYALNFQIYKNIKYEKSNLSIYKINNKNVIKVNTVKVQDFQDIKDESIKLSESYEYLKKANCSYYVIRNNTLNCKLIVGKNHLKFSNKLSENTIKLNRKQRILLNTLDVKDKNNKDINYDLNIYPYPNIAIDGLSFFKKIINAILKLYVGKVNIGLVAKRTYQSDETFNIVRLSSDIMKVLGINDTDIVKLTYLDTSYYSRVLPIDDEEKLLKLNNEDNSIPITEFENIIFIPAFIRAELGIPSVVSNIVVKVERDMGYIFKKNINQQILPIILILFSTEIFVNGRELFIKILIALISLPITMYFNLSNERAICK